MPKINFILLSASKKFSFKKPILSNLSCIKNPTITIFYIYGMKLSIFSKLTFINYIKGLNFVINIRFMIFIFISK